MAKKKFFKIKYLKQENKGPGAARNLGLENSDGDLIAFIDSDCEADINWLDIIYKSYKKITLMLVVVRMDQKITLQFYKKLLITQ